ncbi:MAG: hypothetical protein Kow0029_31690 [Candidatus Rifleibacteriota bacterium]
MKVARKNAKSISATIIIVGFIFGFIKLTLKAENLQDYEIYNPLGKPQPEFAQATGNKEKLFKLFSFIDEYEKEFADFKYLNVLGKLPDVKNRYHQAQAIVRKMGSSLKDEEKILVYLYGAKMQLFTGLTDLMKNLRIDSGYKAALIKSGMYVLSLYDDIISDIRSNDVMDAETTKRIKWKLKTIAGKTQKYDISSKYLKLGGKKIPAGQKVMVLEIKGNRAFVLYMGPTMTDQCIEGWLSLRDLEKRTDWKRENRSFFEVPN